MVGVGESYLPAFVLVLSGSQLASGLVATVPLILGAVLQLVSPAAVRRLGSYRRWVVLCALLQAASFVPLLAAALLGAMPLMLVFALVSLYWGAGLAAGPAWNAWVDTLVPQRLRARYFARRTRVGQWGLLAGFVVGGVTLQLGTKVARPTAAFAVLFCLAAVSRLASARLLDGQREPQPPGEDLRLPAFRGVLRGLLAACGGKAPTRRRFSPVFRPSPGGPQRIDPPGVDPLDTTGRILLYLLVVQAAVQISGPYFTPYMLGQLKLSYAGYVVLICAAYLSKITCLPALGRVADRFGANRLLWIGGAAIVPIAALWNVSDSFAYLCVLQVLSGAAWAAYELAMLLLFFEAIPSRRRVGVLTIFNLANSTAFFAGSIIGGTLLTALGAGRQAYLVLFMVSSLSRAAALLLLARVPQQAAELLAEPARTPATQPPLGAAGQPLLQGIHQRQRRLDPLVPHGSAFAPLPQDGSHGWDPPGASTAWEGQRN
jgi:MFS family permease